MQSFQLKLWSKLNCSAKVWVQKYKPNQQQTRLSPHSALPIRGKQRKKERKKERKSLSHARLFATPWILACTKLLLPWDFQGKSTGVGCHFLLQGIFPTEGLNPGLSHCRQTLYRLSHQGSHISRTDPKSIKEIDFIVKIFST